MVTRVVSMALLLFLSVGCSGASKASQPSPPPPAKRSELFRAMVYSAEFGQRFALPKGGVETLDPGVQAIALRVVQRPGGAPDCFLDFYLDDTLDVAYPEGSEGVMIHPDEEDPRFFVHDPALFGPEGERWNEMLGNYHSVACHQTPKKCMFDGGGPYSFVRHVVPGISLQTYAPICSALEPENGPSEMWLLRQGRDVKDVQDMAGDPSATFRFKVPFSLIEHAAPRVREGVRYFENTQQTSEPPRGTFTVP